MSQRLYKPLNAAEILTQDKLEQLKLTTEDIISDCKPEPYQFIAWNDIAIIKSNILEEFSGITVHAKEKKKQDRISEFPEDLRETIELLTDKHKLTLRDIIKLKKELNKKEFEITSLEEQIVQLNEKARTIEKIKIKNELNRNFIKSYNNFFNCLDPELKKLDHEIKEELKILLNNMIGAINETLKNLD